MAETKKFLTEGKQVKFRTADEYVSAPKGVPHNKLHSKNYKPNPSAPKGR